MTETAETRPVGGVALTKSAAARLVTLARARVLAAALAPDDGIVAEARNAGLRPLRLSRDLLRNRQWGRQSPAVGTILCRVPINEVWALLGVDFGESRVTGILLHWASAWQPEDHGSLHVTDTDAAAATIYFAAAPILCLPGTSLWLTLEQDGPPVTLPDGEFSLKGVVCEPRGKSPPEDYLLGAIMCP